MAPGMRTSTLSQHTDFIARSFRLNKSRVNTRSRQELLRSRNLAVRLSLEVTKGRRSNLSSKNNVNMDHYKTNGRGRQGDGVVYDEYNRLRNQLRSRDPRGLSAKRLLARKRALRAAKQTQSRSRTDASTLSRLGSATSPVEGVGQTTMN